MNVSLQVVFACINVLSTQLYLLYFQKPCALVNKYAETTQMKTTASQTDPVLILPLSHPGNSSDSPVYGNPQLLAYDHPYAATPMVNSIDTAESLVLSDNQTRRTLTLCIPAAVGDMSVGEPVTPDAHHTFFDDEITDPMYVPHVSDIQIGDDTIFKPVSRQPVPSHVTEKKYIICESSLDCLFCMLPCSECSENVSESGIVKRNVGSGLFVKLFCVNGHHVLEWNSQPLLGKMPSCNLLSAAATLYSGNTYARISKFAELLNLQFFSHTVYDEMQTKYLVPVVHNTWVEEQQRVVQLLKTRESVALIGDGRCDSPGYCAKYCKDMSFITTVQAKFE